MATGKSLQLRAIRGPRRKLLVRYTAPGGWDRRHVRAQNGAVANIPKHRRLPAQNVPYVNPARDLRKGRRLRAEARLGGGSR